MNTFRKTNHDKILGVLRIFLGVMFLSTGLMKFTVAHLSDAFSAQLLQADIPFHGFNLKFVPLLEVLLGLALTVGIYSRLAGLVVIPVMLVASYVHLVVQDAALFPLQPNAPVVPLMTLVMAVYILWRGGGAWSLDRKAQMVAEKDR